MLLNLVRAELVWFENPNLPYIQPNWEAHVLADKVDVHFCVAQLPNADGSTTTAVIGAGFWGLVNLHSINNHNLH